MENKKNKFATKAKTILEKSKPSGVGDFLESEEGGVRKSVNTENSKAVETENRTDDPKTVREEFRLPVKLAEKLRAYAFENRSTKTAIIVDALEKFFQNHSV